MLSSTKRYILHGISLTLAIACLTVGLFMKYGTLDVEPPMVLEENYDNIEFTSVSADSLDWITDIPTLSNDD